MVTKNPMSYVEIAGEEDEISLVPDVRFKTKTLINGSIRMDIYNNGSLWLQNGMAGFWLSEQEFSSLYEILTESFQFEEDDDG